MSNRVTRLVDQIRDDMGPFFVARLALRVRLDATGDDEADTEAIVAACIDLGYDPSRRDRQPTH